MKKLLLLFSLFAVLAVNAQVEPPTSKYTKVANGYNWLRGYFKALNLPVGNAPSLGVDQWTASGGIYLDTLSGDGTPEGLYLYIHGVWVFQGVGAFDQFDKLLNGGSVSYTGTDLVFNVTESLVRLCNNIYAFDSIQVTLPPGDADFNKQYVIYLDSTGVHVAEGVPGTPAAVPQLESCQLALTSVLVEAGQTVPAITTQVIYDENTESNVANTGTTTNGANATNVFTGTLSTQVTNINSGDLITWTKVLGGFWSLSGVNTLSLAVKLRAAMPTLSEIRVQLVNGTSAVSGEVIIAVNKNNASTYQQISIPISAFGTITNNNFNIVRIRYTSNNATNFTGYYFDRLELVSGLTVVQPGSSVTSVGLTVSGNLYNVTNSPIVTSGNILLTPAGTADQYVNGQGIRVVFPDFPRVIGPIDGRAKNDDGLTLDGDTLFSHLADRYNNGMMSKEDWARLNRGDSIQNVGDGDSLLTQVNDSTLALKTIKIVGGTIASTDTTVTLTITGGSQFMVNDTVQAALQTRRFNTTGPEFLIRGDSPLDFRSGSAAVDSVGLTMYNQHIILTSLDNGGATPSVFDFSSLSQKFDHWQGNYQFTNMPDSSAAGNHYMLAWNDADTRLYKMPLPTSGTPGTTLTAGEGTVLSGDSIHVGGLIGSPSLFQAERTINLNRKIFHLTNGVAAEAGGAYWQFSYRPYSPYQFISQDTVSTNDVVQDAGRPLSGIFGRRVVYFNSGIYKTQQSYGHYLGQTFSWQDSVVMRNDGMDYQEALIVEQRYKPRNSGYQVIRQANGTGNDARKLHANPTFLANTYYDGVDNASTDTLRSRGVTVGVVSYLVAAPSTGKVRADEHVYFQAGSFVNTNAHFNRSVVLARATSEANMDTTYFLWDTLRTSRSMLNNVVVGFGDSTQSGYQFKVYGTTWQKGAWRYTDGSEGASKVLTSDASGNATWATPASGGVTTMGAITSANANGAIITGSTLQLSPASATTGGILTTGSQQISGNKTFNDLLIAGDELRAENTIRLRDITASGFYNYFQPATLTADHQYYFADDDNAVDTVATRAWARSNIGGGGGSVAWGAITGTLSSQSDLNTALSGKANTALSNLASVAVNTPILPSAGNTHDFGSTSFEWKDMYSRTSKYKGSTSGTVTVESGPIGQLLLGTNLDAQGNIPIEYDLYVRSDETLSNSASDQPLFTNTAHDVIAIKANTTYEFSCTFDLTHGATAHSLAFGMVPTTATITNIAYNTMHWATAVGTQTASQTSLRAKVTSTVALNSSLANATETVEIHGWFTVGNTGGTIQPTIKFSVDPTGTILLKTGAEFHMKVKGNDTFTERGIYQ